MIKKILIRLISVALTKDLKVDILIEEIIETGTYKRNGQVMVYGYKVFTSKKFSVIWGF